MEITCIGKGRLSLRRFWGGDNQSLRRVLRTIRQKLKTKKYW